MRLPERLPELNGRWLTAYRALWFAMLAMTLVALTVGQWRDWQWASNLDRQFHGAGLDPGDEERGALTLEPASPAARAAGVVPNSVLLAIDGQPVLGGGVAGLERVGRALDGPDGREIVLRLRAPDGIESEVRITRGPQHLAAADREASVSSRWLTAIVYGSRTLGALILIAGAVLLFRRRKRDPVVALLSLGLLAVTASDIAALFGDPGLRAAVGDALDVVPMVCILLGMTVFPEGRFTPRFSLLIIPAILAWGVVMVSYGDHASTGLQLAVALPALLLAAASLAARYVRLPQGAQRQQLKWVILGFAGFIVCGLLQAVLSIVEGTIDDGPTQFALLVGIHLLTAAQGLTLVGGFLVALLRYRLYDADAAISRSALYAGLTVTLLAIFAASETLIQTLGQEWFGASTGAAGGAIAASVAAILLVPLHHRLSEWARKRFQRDLTRLRAELPEVLVAIHDSADPVALADDALRLAMRGVHASHGAILLAEGSRLTLAHAEGIAPENLVERLAGQLPAQPSPGVLRADDHSLPARLPLIASRGETVGWLVLGPHPDGSFYGKDDRKALEELAVPLARALALAMERSRREAEREAERQALVERLAQLEQALVNVAGSASPPRTGAA